MAKDDKVAKKSSSKVSNKVSNKVSKPGKPRKLKNLKTVTTAASTKTKNKNSSSISSNNKNEVMEIDWEAEAKRKEHLRKLRITNICELYEQAKGKDESVYGVVAAAIQQTDNIFHGSITRHNVFHELKKREKKRQEDISDKERIKQTKKSKNQVQKKNTPTRFNLPLSSQKQSSQTSSTTRCTRVDLTNSKNGSILPPNQSILAPIPAILAATTPMNNTNLHAAKNNVSMTSNQSSKSASLDPPTIQQLLPQQSLQQQQQQKQSLPKEARKDDHLRKLRITKICELYEQAKGKDESVYGVVAAAIQQTDDIFHGSITRHNVFHELKKREKKRQEDISDKERIKQTKKSKNTGFNLPLSSQKHSSAASTLPTAATTTTTTNNNIADLTNLDNVSLTPNQSSKSTVSTSLDPPTLQQQSLPKQAHKEATGKKRKGVAASKPTKGAKVAKTTKTAQGEKAKKNPSSFQKSFSTSTNQALMGAPILLKPQDNGPENEVTTTEEEDEEDKKKKEEEEEERMKHLRKLRISAICELHEEAKQTNKSVYGLIKGAIEQTNDIFHESITRDDIRNELQRREKKRLRDIEMKEAAKKEAAELAKNPPVPIPTPPPPIIDEKTGKPKRFTCQYPDEETKMVIAAVYDKVTLVYAKERRILRRWKGKNARMKKGRLEELIEATKREYGLTEAHIIIQKTIEGRLSDRRFLPFQKKQAAAAEAAAEKAKENLSTLPSSSSTTTTIATTTQNHSLEISTGIATPSIIIDATQTQHASLASNDLYLPPPSPSLPPSLPPPPPLPCPLDPTNIMPENQSPTGDVFFTTTTAIPNLPHNNLPHVLENSTESSFILNQSPASTTASTTTNPNTTSTTKQKRCYKTHPGGRPRGMTKASKYYNDETKKKVAAVLDKISTTYMDEREKVRQQKGRTGRMPKGRLSQLIQEVKREYGLTEDIVINQATLEHRIRKNMR